MPPPTTTQRSWSSRPAPFPHGGVPAVPTGPAAVYRRRDPVRTPLYPIVQHHLESFLAHAEEADAGAFGVPGWVEEDFRAYLRCGVLAHGFARLRCDGCAAERLVAFSCKGRGVCPSCNTRRMVEVAAHLGDAVLPPVPVRQWVLSLPKRLRPFLPRDPALAGAVLRVLLRAIRTRLGRTTPDSAPEAHLGAVSFLHRFGSALNPHPHFHVVVLDGLFSEEPDGAVRFDEATHLTADHAPTLERTIQLRVLRLFQRRGLLDEATVEDMLGWNASGGFSLDATVRIHGTDRSGRERLLRYCARPPFALERLQIERVASDPERQGHVPVARVLYRPARPLPGGPDLLRLSPLDFLQALGRLIPPPRVHRHRYHGVLAPNARLRKRVVALAADASADAEDPIVQDAAPPGSHVVPSPPGPLSTAERSRWARLIARIYEVSPLACPDCGAEMRILAFLTDPAPVQAILRHLDLPSHPPDLSPARGPPQAALDFDPEPPLDLDQTPPFDPADPEPVPEIDFDQSGF
jgi:hypothetical protein